MSRPVSTNTGVMERMRLYVSADMEGLAGVVSRDDLMPGRFEYEAARDWVTDAVVSVCEAAREMGADELVVSDSHGNGQNIRFERMPEYVRLVRSWPRPLGMMQGVEEGSYAGAFLLGYHAGASNPAGTLAHTISSEFIQEIRLNGRIVSEAGISAAIAGHYGVPILLFAGDDVAVAEARADLGDIATATLKTSLGSLSAVTLAPAAADRVLREAVREAMRRIGTASAPGEAAPMLLEMRLRTRLVAEWLGYLPQVVRTDAFTIAYRAEDIAAASRFIGFLSAARIVLA